MSSLRHNSDSVRDGYLDAARACILDVGWRRTTLTEVARRAGVSRMTIYRTWSDMQQLLGDLMTREWAGVVAASVTPPEEPEPTDRPGRPVDEPSTADRLVTDIVTTARMLRENELFLRIVELDPELLLPYLLARRGRSQDAILALVESQLEAGQRDGSVRTGKPVAIARALVLAAHGHVLSAHTMLGDGVTEDDLDGELATLLSRSLAP